jgi:hypothetical protein
MTDSPSDDPADSTLAAYETAADLYAERTPWPNPNLLAFLNRFAELVVAGDVLELGSGPGRDADYLESLGLRVTRTDGAASFVRMMRDAGHEARQLDFRVDDLGGPYGGLWANATLLHLDAAQCEDVIGRARSAVVDGVLAFTLKEGDGNRWTSAKLDRPRHFTFWREGDVRDLLGRTGWSVLSIDHVRGDREDWLHVLAR